MFVVCTLDSAVYVYAGSSVCECERILYGVATALTDLDTSTINKLLTALNECTEWGQVFILDSLAGYEVRLLHTLDRYKVKTTGNYMMGKASTGSVAAT